MTKISSIPFVVFVLITAVMQTSSAAGLAPISLKKVNVPSIPDLDLFIGKKSSLNRLGKSLFWDQAAGSDGQACASCHFHAGADNRVKNQLSPGLNRVDSNGNPNPDTSFQSTASGGNGGPNYTLVENDFPFHQFNNPDNRSSGVKFTTNDIVSSQGTFGGNFVAVPGVDELDDICDRFPDPVFHVNYSGVRKVEPRHTQPSLIPSSIFATSGMDAPIMCSTVSIPSVSETGKHAFQKRRFDTTG